MSGRLRLLTVRRHWGFDGRVHGGRLVVNRDAAAAMLKTMRSLYRLRFAIRRMRLVDAYGADDHRSDTSHRQPALPSPTGHAGSAA